MLRISKQSRLNPDEILAKASRYFGKGGEGLDETESGPCCISFSEVATVSDGTMKLYFERQPRGGRKGARWWLLSIREPEESSFSDT